MRFIQFLEEVASKGEAVNLVFEERLFNLVGILDKITEPLVAANIPHEVIGGLAVLIHVEEADPAHSVLTRDVELENGQADLSLTATPELAGTVDINAYLFGRDARPVGDHRLIFVQPADELKIETVADTRVYRPGGEAEIGFHVTNSRGAGVHAALGLQVVDEAVFALAEKQLGFAKVFFYLEQEAMKPRYEIHSIGMPDIVEPVEKTQAARRDRAARIRVVLHSPHGSLDRRA